MKDPIPPRITSKIDFGLCWLWTGATTNKAKNKYGRVFWEGKARLVHRVVWTLLVGPIPDGVELDHYCRIHNCCNPEHLEPVTRLENFLRGNQAGARARRSNRCVHGHDLTDAYIDKNGARNCRTCTTERNQARDRRMVAA